MCLSWFSGLEQRFSEEIFPFDLDQIVNYDGQFILGHESEVYQRDLKAGFDVADGIMDTEIRAEITKKCLATRTETCRSIPASRTSPSSTFCCRSGLQPTFTTTRSATVSPSQWPHGQYFGQKAGRSLESDHAHFGDCSDHCRHRVGDEVLNFFRK